MTRNPSLHASSLNDHSVFVAHCDYGKKGFEALVDMAMTRAEVISRIASADFGFEGVIRVDEYNVAEGWAREITDDILHEVELLKAASESRTDPQASAWDHARDLLKHEVA